VLPRRLLIAMLVPVALLIIGTIGYKIIEGPDPHWTWLDALYMTVITLTTVGYGETHPLSPAGKLFTIFLCLGGIFTIFYAAGELIRTMVSGEIQNAIGRRRMERSLADMHDHFLVCGYGRMGRMVCKEFDMRKLPYVVTDRDEKMQAGFASAYGIFMHGDATAEGVLEHAGIARAKALVAVAGSDADNLFIVLSARLLNPKLYIVARAEDPAAEAKLRRVGADQVVSPYAIGGRRVAHAVLRPTVVDFIEMATRTDYVEMQIEEIRLKPGSALVGQTLAQCRLRQDVGVIIVAIKKQNGALNASPTGDTVLDAESTLVVLGHREQLDQMEKLAREGA
jgi:voltage-gated potassium channel